MSVRTTINYIEFASNNLAASKAFFVKAFAWKFTDYGAEYSAFSADTAGIDGGIYASKRISTSENGAPLVVFYSSDLEATQQCVEEAGANINQAIFSFPGGRRFHFIEPGGNELAVWSE